MASKPAARIGDMHICPKTQPGPVPHVGGPIVQGSGNVIIGGSPAARVGDMAVCIGPPDKASSGSATVFINGKAATRMGDASAHGGKIIMGCPTVLIGDSSGSATFSNVEGSNGNTNDAKSEAKFQTEKFESNIQSGKVFIGQYKGQEVEMHQMEIRQIEYTKRDELIREKLRSQFNSVRKKLMIEMANNPETVQRLKRAGIGDKSIEKMKNGQVPTGWQVHHKLPLDDGGDNSIPNLVLIKNSPAHSAITTYQKQNTEAMRAGETKVLEWPIPPGDIYPVEPSNIQVSKTFIKKKRKLRK